MREDVTYYEVISHWLRPCSDTNIYSVEFSINTLRLRKNGWHFADDIIKCIFLEWKWWILIKIWLKFVPNGPVNLIMVLVQIMACRLVGAKPLSEPMMVRLPTHICVTRPQRVNAWVLDNERRYSTYKVFTHWPRPRSHINRKHTKVTADKANCVQAV